jgi:translocation protein SEC63
MFLFSMASIFIVPYSLHRLFGEDDSAAGAPARAKAPPSRYAPSASKRPSALARAARRARRAATPRLAAAWLAYAALFAYVSHASKPMERFDPFAILEIPEDAGADAVKRAYRRLSLKYHPDKNPDPAAGEYFAHSVVKAYKALTDEVSRENFRKHGHPDGPQAVSISVALPEWFFSKEKDAAPVILLSLLLGGIVLPLGLAACWLGRSGRSGGPAGVAPETLAMYWHSPYNVKPSQGVARVPETLVCALEFIKLPIGPGQGPALEELRRALAESLPELRDVRSPFFAKRRAELVKAHMLLLAHLARVPVPAALAADAALVVAKAPALLQEMFNAAAHPSRVKPAYGWLTPSLAVVEALQCLVRAVPLEEKRRPAAAAFAAPGAGGAPAPGAALLQLPKLDGDAVRALARGGGSGRWPKARSLQELMALAPGARREALQGAGLSGADADEVEAALADVPQLFVSAQLFVEDGAGGEAPAADTPAVAWQSVLCARVRVLLARGAHAAPGGLGERALEALDKGRAPRALAPLWPAPRDEAWFFFVADPATNALLGWARASLAPAEAAGARHGAAGARYAAALAPGAPPAAGDALASTEGQTVEVRFLAPSPGIHQLLLIAMPDAWLGADRAVSLGRLRSAEPTRAEKEGRAVAAAPRAAAARAEGGGGEAGGGAAAEGADGAAAEGARAAGAAGAAAGAAGAGAKAAGSGDEEEEEGEEEEEEEEEEGEPVWDSDEFGTEETASEAGSGAGGEDEGAEGAGEGAAAADGGGDDGMPALVPAPTAP